MSTADAAQLFAGIVAVALILVLAIVGKRVWVVGTAFFDPPEGTDGSRRFLEGTVVTQEIATAHPTEVKRVRRSWLAGLTVGKDHRTSTSKTVAFAWTMVLLFGLASLLLALILGVRAPWEKLMSQGIQEEYIVLLGGPYAAAVLAKYAATTNADSKADGPVGGAGFGHLVSDDEGDTDLGDFQYVAFNLIAIGFFLADFIGDPAGGFPNMPPTLAALTLASAGGYGAKKLVAAARPILSSALPAEQKRGGSVQVFGTNLTVPASVSGTQQPLGPTVTIGSVVAEVTAADNVLGNDRLTVKIPLVAALGQTTISVARADGVVAQTPAGVTGVPFTVLPADDPAP